jgi:hypothetical protein
VTTGDGKILATLVNYACHPTTLAWQNRLISPNYVGALREVVERNTDGAPCLFLQGASGDLGPREGLTGDTAVPDRHGRSLGYAVMSVLGEMLPHATELRYGGVVESGAQLATWERQPFSPSGTLRALRIETVLPLKESWTADAPDPQWRKLPDRVLQERLTPPLPRRNAHRHERDERGRCWLSPGCRQL